MREYRFFVESWLFGAGMGNASASSLQRHGLASRAADLRPQLRTLFIPIQSLLHCPSGSQPPWSLCTPQQPHPTYPLPSAPRPLTYPLGAVADEFTRPLARRCSEHGPVVGNPRAMYVAKSRRWRRLRHAPENRRARSWTDLSLVVTSAHPHCGVRDAHSPAPSTVFN
ncbi:hypothetical protein EDB89DRAFT_113277 [Lactarius sanguifluus]|nr:hypothetical protein EDB89DRAFT_113277 [Lactarius sanguifluus]